MTSPRSPFPDTWNLTEFRDSGIQILDGDRGKNYPTRDEFLSEGHCVFLNTSNIKNDTFQLTHCDFISESKDSALRKGKLSRGDIVVTTRGTVGSIGYFHSRIPYDHIRINSGMVILRSGPSIDQYFLYQLLKSPVCKAQYRLFSSGAAQPQLPIKDFRRISFPLPPLAEQQKIAAILTAYDDLIENNRQRITLLEKMAEEIYREWFVRLRFPGHEQTPVNKGVPEGWSESKLAALCDEQRLAVRKQAFDEPTRYVGLEHIPRRRMTLDDFELVDSIGSNKFRFAAGDILFGKIRPYLHKAARAGFSGVCSTDAIVLRPNSPDVAEFVLHTVFSNSFIDLATTASKGTKMPRADWDFLSNALMLIPSAALLAKFSAKVKPMFDLAQALTTQNESLRQTRDLLLNRLISGKLCVDDLDIQFPPSIRDAA